MEKFEINVLGCGSAKPSPIHNPSCTVVNFRDNLFMIDCGEGAQKEFQRQRLKFSRLNHIFLTHLHGDHVFGLPGLIGTMALSGLEGDITIHTFEDGKKILTSIFDYFNRGLPIDVKFNVIHPEESVIFENSSLRIGTVPLRHKIPAVGYVFEEKPRLRHINREMCDYHDVPLWAFNAIKSGDDFTKPDGTVIPNTLLTKDPLNPRSYAHISDTAYMPDLAEKIQGVDLLFHETTYLTQDLDKAKERGHSTATQAAQIALDAKAKCLLTGHYSSRYKNDNLFLEEAKTVFPNVILGKEGLKIMIDDKLQI
ncbi:MAG: ribonuclease Z [Muribaculaceae bacterium]|nr:ribonuclease Z [Muribaculaceae bacterium]